jgi:hypothetical protein
VNTSGRVENCRVIEAMTTAGDETMLFDRVACAAAEQFR